MTPNKERQPRGVHATPASPAKGFAPLLGALRQFIVDSRQQVLRAVDEVQVQTAFPIRDALRRELSWTHYRLPSQIDSKLAP